MTTLHLRILPLVDAVLVFTRVQTGSTYKATKMIIPIMNNAIRVALPLMNGSNWSFHTPLPTRVGRLCTVPQKLNHNTNPECSFGHTKTSAHAIHCYKATVIAIFCK